MYRCSDIINKVIIYHGSEHIIEKPQFNGSKRTNDFGYGFYTTESKDLAKEWACGKRKDGFVNAYEFDIEDLSVLHLDSPDCNILNWLALLAEFRTYWQKGSVSEEAKDYLRGHFLLDISDYDVIVGYRADDSYFSFAQDFVSGVISLRKLSEAMHLGKLGEQIVLKSEKAFKCIRFIGVETADAGIFYEKKVTRDREARRAYRMTRQQYDRSDELFMLDIMREGIENGDPRLR